MTPLILSCIAACLGLMAAYIGHANVRGTLAIAALVGLSTLIMAEPSGSLNLPTDTIQAQAVSTGGAPVEITLEWAVDAQRQSINALRIVKPMSVLHYLIWSLFALGTIGLFILSFGGSTEDRPKYLAWLGVCLLLAAGSICLLPEFWQSYGGEAAIRRYLEGFTDTASIVSFSVSESTWHFELSGTKPLYGLSLVSLVCLLAILRPWLPSQDRWSPMLLAAGVLLSMLAVFWQSALVGGFSWRVLDGGLTLSCLILCTAFWMTQSEKMRSAIAGIAVVPLLFLL